MEYWIIGGITLYILIAIFHVFYLVSYAKKNAIALDANSAVLIPAVSIIWPVTWIWYGISKLSRVA